MPKMVYDKTTDPNKTNSPNTTYDTQLQETCLAVFKNVFTFSHPFPLALCHDVSLVLSGPCWAAKHVRWKHSVKRSITNHH